MPRLSARRLRLASGLVLLVYLATHLANHALGLVSLAAMEAGRLWFVAFWRNPLATTILYTALLLHVILALTSLYRRRHFRMPAWEVSQIVLGLAIPPLLVAHIVGTRLATTLFGATDSYTRVVLNLWELSPAGGVRQSVVLVVAWAHACIGVHFWLRFRPWYPRLVPWLYTVTLLLPALALLGFVQAGREISVLARTPGWVEQTLRRANAPTPAARARLAELDRQIIGAFALALTGVVLLRAARDHYRRRVAAVRILYPDGRQVFVPAGSTVLEASRAGGIPHLSVCGGRGRCSTCRVRVVHGLDTLPAPTPEELRVLTRVGAPPDVRLACQTRPRGDLAVVPVLAAGGVAPVGGGNGREKELAILFADLRAFTRMAEHKLPYDVVFILNRYFEAISAAIRGAGGIANQFTGDGVMALFGVDTDADGGCRDAVRAARAMVRAVEALSRELAGELKEPLRIGIGIHVGSAVVGRMGDGDNRYLTAVGDPVHVASRLEQATKDYGCELVISEAVGRRAGLDLAAFRRDDLAVRNRAGRVPVVVIERVSQLG